ncbi:hypothetical protein [Bradyrhizobium sp. HKCCYLRH3061]|uniref:hypothetical protein n=1 Tax=Bradyrhizobium sp. HKCCYLRH3061 TaxID=3420734 RepID=UPI003EB9033F
MLGMVIGGIMIAAGAFLTLVPPFFIGPILFVGGLIIGMRGMTKTAVTGAKLTSSALSAVASSGTQNATRDAVAVSGNDYNRAKWATLLEVDAQIREAADSVGRFGDSYVEQLAYKYLSVDDKSYLPTIVDNILSAAKSDALRAEAAKEEEARKYAAQIEQERETSLRRRATARRLAPMAGVAIAVVAVGMIVYENFFRTEFPDSDLSAAKVWESEESAVLFLLHQAEAGVTQPTFHVRWTGSGPSVEFHAFWSEGKPHFVSLTAKKIGLCKYLVDTKEEGGESQETIDINKIVTVEKGSQDKDARFPVFIKGSVDDFYCIKQRVNSLTKDIECGGHPYPRGPACRKDYKCPANYNPMVVSYLPRTYPDRVISAYNFLRSKCS